MTAGRYPRTCRGKGGPHVITGPADEVSVMRPGGRRALRCRACRLELQRRATARYAATERGAAVIAAQVERRITSGRHAETKARYDRRRAEARDAELLHDHPNGCRDQDQVSRYLRP